MVDFRPLTVLVVEDHPVNRLILETWLNSAGHACASAENGQLAIEACATQAFDLVLMDVNMPVLDGLAATRAIRSAERASGRRRTPIIAVSANAMNHQVSDYLAVGMDDHVPKPIELARLHGAIIKSVSADFEQDQDEAEMTEEKDTNAA